MGGGGFNAGVVVVGGGCCWRALTCWWRLAFCIWRLPFFRVMLARCLWRDWLVVVNVFRARVSAALAAANCWTAVLRSRSVSSVFSVGWLVTVALVE